MANRLFMLVCPMSDDSGRCFPMAFNTTFAGLVGNYPKMYDGDMIVEIVTLSDKIQAKDIVDYAMFVLENSNELPI